MDEMSLLYLLKQSTEKGCERAGKKGNECVTSAYQIFV